MLICDDRTDQCVEESLERLSRLPDFADALGKALAELLQQTELEQKNLDSEPILKRLRDRLLDYAQSQSGRRAAVLGEAIARMGRRSLDCVRELQYARGEEIVAKLMLQLCDEVFLAAPTLPGTNPMEAKMAYCMTCNILRKCFKSRGSDRASNSESSVTLTSCTSTADPTCQAAGNSRSITSSPNTPRPSATVDEAQRCAHVLSGLGRLLPELIYKKLSAEVFFQLGVDQQCVSARGASSAEEQAIAAWLAQNAECNFTLKAAAARVIRLARQQIQERGNKIAPAVRVAMSSASSEIAEVEKMVVPDHAMLRKLEWHGPLHVTLVDPLETSHVSNWAAVTIPNFAKEIVKLGGKLDAVDTFIEALTMKVASEDDCPLSTVFALDALVDIVYDALHGYGLSINPQTRGRIKQQVRTIFKRRSDELRDKEVDKVVDLLAKEMPKIVTWRTPDFDAVMQHKVASGVSTCLVRSLIDATLEYAECNDARINILHSEMVSMLAGNKMTNQMAEDLLDRVLGDVSSSSVATTFLLKLVKRVARLVDEKERRARSKDAIDLSAPEKKPMAFVEDFLITLTENVLRQFTSLTNDVLSHFAAELGNLVASMRLPPTLSAPSSRTTRLSSSLSVPNWDSSGLSEDLRARCTRLGDWLGEELLRFMKERIDTTQQTAGHVSNALHAQPLGDIRAMVQLIVRTAIRNITKPGHSGRLAQRDAAYAEEMLTNLMDHLYTTLSKNRHFSPEEKERFQRTILEMKPLIRHGLNEKRHLSRVSEWSVLPPVSVRSATPETTHPRGAPIRGSKRSDTADASDGGARMKKSGSRRRNFDIDSLLEKDAAVDSLVASIDAEQDPAKRADNASALMADLESVFQNEKPVTADRARRATRCLEKMSAVLDDALGTDAAPRKLRAQARNTWLRRITHGRQASESVIIGEWMVDMWQQAIAEDAPPSEAAALERTLVNIATEKAVDLAVRRSGDRPTPDKMRSSVAGVMKVVKDSFLGSITDPVAQQRATTVFSTMESDVIKQTGNKAAWAPISSAHRSIFRNLIREEEDRSCCSDERRSSLRSYNSLDDWYKDEPSPADCCPTTNATVLRLTEPTAEETSPLIKLTLPAKAHIEFDTSREEAVVAKSLFDLRRGDEIVFVNDVKVSGRKRAVAELHTIASPFSVHVQRTDVERESERRKTQARHVPTPLTRPSAVQDVQLPLVDSPGRLHLPSVTESFAGRLVSSPRMALSRDRSPRGKLDLSPCSFGARFSIGSTRSQCVPVEEASRNVPGPGAYLIFHHETRNFELHWFEKLPPEESIYTLLGFFVGTKNVPSYNSTMEHGTILCRRDLTDRRNVFNAWVAFIKTAAAHGASQVHLFALEGPSLLHFGTKLCFKDRRTQKIRIQRAGEESIINFVDANGHIPSAVVALHPNNLIFDGVYTLQDTTFVEEGKSCGSAAVIPLP